MGMEKSFERLEPQGQSSDSGSEEEIIDKAIEEAQARIREDLKEAQGQSGDDFFGKINIDSMGSEALMVLNEFTKKNNPFPKKLLEKAALKMVSDSPIYQNKLAFENQKEKQEYLDEFLEMYGDKVKEIIAADPDSFYTKDLLEEAEENPNSHN